MGLIHRSTPGIQIMTLLLVAGCAAPERQGVSDSLLHDRVQTALRGASDVPGSQLAIQVRDGVVTITGSLECADCGGQATPGGTGTIEQSVGAVVRAIPGVRAVEFATDSAP